VYHKAGQSKRQVAAMAMLKSVDTKRRTRSKKVKRESVPHNDITSEMSEVILNLKTDLKIPSDTEEIDCSEDNPEPKSSEKAECK